MGRSFRRAAPPPAPGCQKARPTCTRATEFLTSCPTSSARMPESSLCVYTRDALSIGAGVPSPANGANAPAREAHAGNHAAGVRMGRGFRQAPRGPARILTPVPRAAPPARGNRWPWNGAGSTARPGRPLLAWSVALVPFPSTCQPGDGARRRPVPSLTGQLATNSRHGRSRQAPAARAVGRPGFIPVGSRPSLGPWQGTPDVSTHAGSPLPLGRPFPPGWGQAPDGCARSGSLPPWVRRLTFHTSSHLGKRQMRVTRVDPLPWGTLTSGLCCHLGPRVETTGD